MKQSTEVLVIGTGQAGLGACYYLKKRGITFLAVDADIKAGESWRKRWDNLRLFTPANFDSLPGRPLQYPGSYLPSKDEMAAYISEYAQQFDSSIQFSCATKKLRKTEDGFEAITSKGNIYAKQVIVATGGFHVPRVPDFAANLTRTVQQLHTSDYHNQTDIPPGEVVVVGAGNSGAQIAVELCENHQVTVIGKKERLSLPQAFLGKNVFWWLRLAGILNAQKDGFWSRYIKRHGDILIGKDFNRAVKAGKIKLIHAKLQDAKASKLIVSNGNELTAKTIIWATGYKPAYQWVEIEGAVDSNGLPVQTRGVASIEGLYWVGMPWQSALKSGLVNGVNEDAKFVVDNLKGVIKQSQ